MYRVKFENALLLTGGVIYFAKWREDLNAKESRFNSKVV